MVDSQTSIQLALANFAAARPQSKYTNVIDVQALAALFIEKHLQRDLQRYLLLGLRTRPDAGLLFLTSSQ